MPKKIKLKKGEEAQQFVEDMTMNPDKKKTYKGGNFRKAIDNVEEAAKQTAKDQFKEYKPEKLETNAADKKMKDFNKSLKIRGARKEGDAVKKYKDNKGNLVRSKGFNMPTFKRTKDKTNLLSTANQTRKRTATIGTLSSMMGTKSTTGTSSSAKQTGAALLKGKY